jgi:hypothetical protein
MQHELTEEEQEQQFSKGMPGMEEWLQFMPVAIWKEVL